MLPQSRRVLLCASSSLYVGVVKFLLPSQADSAHVNRQHAAGLDWTFSGPPCLGDEETVPRPFVAPLQAYHRKQEACSPNYECAPRVPPRFFRRPFLPWRKVVMFHFASC